MEEKDIRDLKLKAKKLKGQIDRHNENIKFFNYCKKNIDKFNAIVLDLETTGINLHDEILQISIIDMNERIVFNKYTKPEKVESWDDSFEIHNISKEIVENKKNISYYKQDLNKIFNKHRLLIGYTVQNDIRFLRRVNIDLKNIMVLDISYLFSILLFNKGITKERRIPSLKEVSNYYGFEYSAHNALNDTIATLYCFKKLLLEDEKFLELKYDENILKYYEDKKEIPKTKYELLKEEYIKIYEDYEEKIILDLETTGIREDDEIIQLSIMNDKKELLFNEYIKPSYVKEWDDAFKIHKISREFLENKKQLEYFRNRIQEILDNSKYIIGYGIDFDIKLLKRFNFNLDNLIKVDISEYFKYLNREILNDIKAKRPKLIECASYYGFKADNYHDSLTDIKATKFSYDNIYKDFKRGKSES